MSIYDLALKIDASATISQLYSIFDKLDALNIDVDMGTLEIEKDGAFILAGYSDSIAWPEIERYIGLIDGLTIDYDAMADWLDMDDETEQGASE